MINKYLLTVFDIMIFLTDFTNPDKIDKTKKP